jgi:hypothetical protein
MKEAFTHNDLLQKAKLLKETKHFTGNNTAHDLSDKQSILLVLAGKKPLSKVISGQWAETAEGRTAGPDDEESLARLCEDLGLAYHIESDEYGTDVVLALDQRLIDKYLASDTRDDLGTLFGYPDSAIASFDTSDMMSDEEQSQVMARTGLPETMPQFRMSRQHATEELQVMIDWANCLGQYELM